MSSVPGLRPPNRGQIIRARPARPVIEIQDMREQMDRLLEDLIGGALQPGAAGGVWVPDVDIEENDDAWLVEADVPGAKKDDMSVDLQEGELVIHGEIKEKERAGILRRRSRRVGEFEYRVRLPGDVDAEGIQAKLKDGVLTVRVPKPQRTQPRRITVEAE
jgi:HSP20 family protein